jgi:hypothetical protein
MPVVVGDRGASGAAYAADDDRASLGDEILPPQQAGELDEL